MKTQENEKYTCKLGFKNPDKDGGTFEAEPRSEEFRSVFYQIREDVIRLDLESLPFFGLQLDREVQLEEGGRKDNEVDLGQFYERDVFEIVKDSGAGPTGVIKCYGMFSKNRDIKYGGCEKCRYFQVDVF